MTVLTEFNREMAKDGKEMCCCGGAAQLEQGSTMESVQGNLPVCNLRTAKQDFQTLVLLQTEWQTFTKFADHYQQTVSLSQELKF